MRVQSRQSVKRGFPRPKGGAFSTAFANTREIDRPCFGGHARWLVRCASREARRVGWSVFSLNGNCVCACVATASCLSVPKRQNVFSFRPRGFLPAISSACLALADRGCDLRSVGETEHSARCAGGPYFCSG